MNSQSTEQQNARPVGLEHLTLQKDPVSVFVGAAASAGADSICLSVNHPDVVNPQALTDTMARIADANLTVTMGDGFLLRPGDNLDGLKQRLDLLVEIGGPYANVCTFEPDESVHRDPDLVEDLLGEFCRLAAAAEVSVLIEFTPLSHVPSLAAAVKLAGQINQPNLQILVDTLHLARAGEGPDDMAKVDPNLFGYCQLSDGSVGTMALGAYLAEAMYNRDIPGDGELPLERILALLPPTVTVSAEVPLQRLKDAGISADERARRIIEGSRRVMNRVEIHSVTS